ncbi:hypothetical protein [Dictyobacter arantiisoli]|uniref:Ricin B lectin domain-containing protein n=1 Tax=Dictyobacter arantiisoli TaxID=2014874 RepID=A0A5A5TKA6_9CHLR|nr:hypothetical protein [Dictyobacter arantiisoli]GCF11324.1 hypothetical protein KDI_48880 [Dictyobacter arantiisoli]
MTRKQVWFVFCLALLLLCLGFFPIQSMVANAALKSTTVNHFFPSGVRSDPAQAGNCWETSLADPRPDAWRCIVGNTIYDPCFSALQQKSYVICDANPAGDTRGMKVTFLDSLPASTATKNTARPWILQLSDGTTCTFITGATALINGERVNYACNDQSVIPGYPKQGTIWTVRAFHDTSKPPVIASIKTVWT